MNAWSQLPNAELIDWVLKSLKDKPQLWAAAHLDVTWDATRHAAEDAARIVDLAEARHAVRIATWCAARIAAGAIDSYLARDTARCVLSALVAYDDCNEYLAMTYEQLHAWAILSETPQAVLLLPMKWVQENCKSTVVQQFDNKCTL